MNYLFPNKKRWYWKGPLKIIHGSHRKTWRTPHQRALGAACIWFSFSDGVHMVFLQRRNESDDPNYERNLLLGDRPCFGLSDFPLLRRLAWLTLHLLASCLQPGSPRSICLRQPWSDLHSPPFLRKSPLG